MNMHAEPSIFETQRSVLAAFFHAFQLSTIVVANFCLRESIDMGLTCKAAGVAAAVVVILLAAAADAASLGIFQPREGLIYKYTKYRLIDSKYHAKGIDFRVLILHLNSSASALQTLGTGSRPWICLASRTGGRPWRNAQDLER